MCNAGEKIKNKRIEIGWTQEELAIRMGYKSKSTINKIELGINDVSQSKLKKFADVFNVSPSALIPDDNFNEENADILTEALEDEEILEMVKMILDLDKEDRKFIKNLLKKTSGD